MAIVSDMVPSGVYLAICEDCVPIVPKPFKVEEERNLWAIKHRVIGHTVHEVNSVSK